MDKDFKYDRWADEKKAADHLKLKPSTLRTRLECCLKMYVQNPYKESLIHVANTIINCN